MSSWVWEKMLHSNKSKMPTKDWPWNITPRPTKSRALNRDSSKLAMHTTIFLMNSGEENMTNISLENYCQ
jgi:hypothetical protein